MQSGEKLYLVLVGTLSNLSWFLVSAAKYGNPFRPIIDLIRKVVKK